MTSWDVLGITLVVLAGVWASLSLGFLVFLIHELFKPRGKVKDRPEPQRVQVKVNRPPQVNEHMVNADLERDPREIGKLIARQVGRS